MSERRCNDCTLCCKLLPVRELGKPANTRCTHQRAKGCTVYGGDDFPRSCRIWSCAWLLNADADDLPRPDRAHYVIDLTPDFVEGAVNGRPVWRVPVVQIWVDPKHPDAHRDPALRAWLERRAQRTPQLALVRSDSQRGLVLAPPCMTDSGQWEEQPGEGTGAEHSAQEVHETLTRIARRKASGLRDE